MYNKRNILIEFMDGCFNLKFLEEISGGDKEKLKYMMEAFIAEAPKYMEKIKEAHVSRDFDALHRVSHALKPLYLSIGAEKATLILKNIENYSRSAFYRELIPVEIQELDKINKEICQDLKYLMQINF